MWDFHYINSGISPGLRSSCSSFPQCQWITAPSSRELEPRLSGPHLLSVGMKIKLPTGPCQVSQSHPVPGILLQLPSIVPCTCRCCAQPGPWAPLPLWIGKERRRKGANAGVMFGACLDRRISACSISSSSSLSCSQPHPLPALVTEVLLRKNSLSRLGIPFSCLIVSGLSKHSKCSFGTHVWPLNGRVTYLILINFT